MLGEMHTHALCHLPIPSMYANFFSLGIREAFNPYAVLHLIPVGVGEVKIQGLESGLFLAMNPKGNLYAETDDSNEATIFLESSNGYYLNYLSKKYAHMGWHVGITQQGRAKNGKKTWYPWGQNAIQFVARKPYDEPHPLRYKMKKLFGGPFSLLIKSFLLKQRYRDGN